MACVVSPNPEFSSAFFVPLWILVLYLELFSVILKELSFLSNLLNEQITIL